MIVLEIIREAEKRTHVKAIKNGKRIIVIGCIVSALLTIAFYFLGIIEKDPLYHQIPLVVGIPTILLHSFNAVGVTSILILFLKSLGESTNSTVKNSLEQRNETKIKAQAKAIHNRINEFGQQDFSLQIDETKAGLEAKIKTIQKENGDQKIEISQLKSEVEGLKSQVEAFKREKSEKEQEISEKAHAHNNTENTKSLDTDEKFE